MKNCNDGDDNDNDHEDYAPDSAQSHGRHVSAIVHNAQKLGS